jgi:hypothetical protein
MSPLPFVGNDFPLTEGFAQEGASEETPLGLAILAVAVPTSARTPLILRYITPSTALIVGVVNLLVCGFFGFVDRVIRTDFRHIGFLLYRNEKLGAPKGSAR